MSWKPEVDEINQRYAWAEEMGGAETIAKRHKNGYLTIRERISGVVDDGSFREVGKLAGKGSYKDGKLVGFKPAPYVMGMAKIDGRPVAIGGEDTTLRGGTNWGTTRRKGGQGGFIDDFAYYSRIPLIRLIDGYGGSASTAKRLGFSALPGHSVENNINPIELMEIVPVVGAVMGIAAGGPAGRAVFSHWSVMVKGQSQIFAAGPSVVERGIGRTVSKEELGGYKVAADNAGVIQNVAKSEEACFQQIRQFLSYLPSNIWELPPCKNVGDPVDRIEEELLEIVPRDRRKPYDMRKVIKLIVDTGSFFEIQATHGRSAITVLARLNGHTVGIIANNPMYGGVVDVKAARKQTHFIDLCDQFHIPLLFFVDVPGFNVGVDAEMAGTLREGMNVGYAKAQANVPMISLITRKCYGMAGGAVLDKFGLDFKIAWPSAEWGSLPIEGGVDGTYRREIASADDPDKRRKELEMEMRALSSPFLTAEAFGIEDIIDPRETRAYLCDFIEMQQPRIRTTLGPKIKGGTRP